MRDRLVAIHLHGPLGERYGDLHRLAVHSPREAIHALDANFPGFLAAFAAHQHYGIFVDDEFREGEAGAIMPASKDIHFVPVVEGNVPLVVAGLGFIGITGTAATIIGSLLVVGLMIGISLLFRPKKPEQEEQKKDESFIFSGPENVTGQGVAVPLIYGRVFAGSVVVSAGQDTVDMIVTTPVVGAAKPAVASTVKPNKPGTAVPVKAPAYKGATGHGRAVFARSAPPLAPTLLTEEPFDPWPDLANEGAGTDHLREPPPEGWPAIVADPVYGHRPESWVPVKTIWVTEEDDANRKQVMVWQPDYETDEFVYNWNMVRGFYVTDTQMEAEEAEWIAGEAMEIPSQEPSA